MRSKIRITSRRTWDWGTPCTVYFARGRGWSLKLFRYPCGAIGLCDGD